MNEHEGKVWRYSGGCRCLACRTAWRDYYREYRERPGKRAAIAASQRRRYHALLVAAGRAAPETMSPTTETD